MNEDYITKDLYEASFLYAKGIKFLCLQNAGKYMWFVFEDKNKCESLTQEYWSGTAIVNAKAITDAQRSLKDRLFSK